MTPNLAKEDGHEVVVEQEGFWEAWIVELEEEDGETESDVLLRGCAEGGAKQLHSSHGDEQSSTTVEMGILLTLITNQTGSMKKKKKLCLNVQPTNDLQYLNIIRHFQLFVRTF